MFKKHAEEYNPIAELLRKFMEGRDEHKAEMFKYPKGSEQFEKYNLLQLLDKIDALREKNSEQAVIINNAQ